MIYFIEEALKVYINNMLVTFIDVILRLLYSLQSIAIGSESVAVFFEWKISLK